MSIKVYKKKNLTLREDIDKTSYVTKSSQNSSDGALASDIQNAENKNPSSKNFVVNGNNYDNNTSDDTLTLNVQAKNSTDAANKIKALNNSQQVKKLGGNAMYNVQMESIRRKLRESAKFKKRDLKNLFQQ